MLVDVVELNYRGKRLPREVWKNAPPIRAELSMLKYFSWHGHENAPVFATLTPYRLESLDRDVRLKALEVLFVVLDVLLSASKTVPDVVHPWS